LQIFRTPYGSSFRVTTLSWAILDESSGGRLWDETSTSSDAEALRDQEPPQVRAGFLS
jgi:hypothetical protein